MDGEKIFEDFDMTKFTYDGWEEDLTDLRNEIISPCKMSLLKESSIRLKKEKMERKQQIADGSCRDKSFLRLQNFNSKFTYEDFKEDRELAMEKFVNYGHCDMIVFELKQHLHDGNFSHPLLKEYRRYVSLCGDNPEWAEDKMKVKSLLFDMKYWGFNREFYARILMRKVERDCSRIENAKHILDLERFNYPNFENDREQILKNILSFEHQDINMYLPILKIRQAFHDGDESHPILEAMKNKRFTYTCWEEDMKRIKDKLLRDHCLCAFIHRAEWEAERMLTGAMRKQQIHEKDDLFLMLDDDVFDYEGFEEDKQYLFDQYTKGFTVQNEMKSILRKQKLHNGKVSNPVIDAFNQLNGIDEQIERNVVQDDVNSSSVCIICLQHPRSHAFVPCGHMCLCDHCSSRSPYSEGFSRNVLSCPICRESSSAIMKIYNS